jgi:CheY-like chemotaxis protein/tetratricopeptide (TPR) repeat protein
MRLASQVTKGPSSLTAIERARLALQSAKQLERAGEYEAAREAIVEFWPDRFGPPQLVDLDQPTSAEVLLRVGSLTGSLTRTDQSEIGQETAKDLITRSIEMFEQLDDRVRTAEARTDLAICYWREGAFDEARINLARALQLLDEQDTEQRAVTLIWSGLVEKDAGQLHEALRIYQDAAPVIEQTADDAIKGAFHNDFGLVLRRLASPENREEYIDRALLEYTAASFHFERAGNHRYLASVENNLGYLFFVIGRYQEAHHHLDRARHLFLQLKDFGAAAQVEETRARVFLAEGHLKDALRLIRSSVKTLEKGGEQALLAEALTTQGVVQARMRNHAQARTLLQRAAEIAHTAGDLEGAGRAQLSIIEELSAQTRTAELAAIYESAAELLRRSQDPSSNQRLIACARNLIARMAAEEHAPALAIEPETWEGFSLKREIRKIEKTVIERALRDAGGSVSKASRLLGFKHHQSLIALIQGRHSDLQEQRSIVRRRRHHLFSKARTIRKKAAPIPTAEMLAVLHVEDNKPVARLVRDTLAVSGMQVDPCVNGLTAFEILKSSARYDALIVDNNLPGLSGLELVLRLRSLPHRADMPVIMLAGDDCEKEAWRAGVDAFLMKPKGVDQLASTITRIRKEPRKQDK